MKLIQRDFFGKHAINLPKSVCKQLRIAREKGQLLEMIPPVDAT